MTDFPINLNPTPAELANVKARLLGQWPATNSHHTATDAAVSILVHGRRALYSDARLTIRQADMRARRLNNAIAHLKGGR